jgi:hypothetical protein
MPLTRNTLSWAAFLEQIGHSAINRQTREESTNPGGTTQPRSSSRSLTEDLAELYFLSYTRKPFIGTVAYVELVSKLRQRAGSISMLKTRLLSKAPDTYLAHTLTEGRCSTRLAFFNSLEAGTCAIGGLPSLLLLCR